MSSLVLKPCTPQDVKEAVPLIYASGPASFEFVFKNDRASAQDFLSYAFLRRGGEFSFDNHWALWQDEQIVGVGAFFNQKRASSFIFTDALNIVSFYGIKFLPIALNGLNVEGIIKLPKKNEITLGHLGIRPELRGAGLGTQLIQLLMEEANADSGECFVLDVSEENLRAKNLYENLGFRVVEKNESKLKNKYSYVANHFRMKLY